MKSDYHMVEKPLLIWSFSNSNKVTVQYDFLNAVKCLRELHPNIDKTNPRSQPISFVIPNDWNLKVGNYQFRYSTDFTYLCENACVINGKWKHTLISFKNPVFKFDDGDIFTIFDRIEGLVSQ